MGNLQLKLSQNPNYENIPHQKPIEPMTRVGFKYIDPIKFDNQGIPDNLLLKINENKKLIDEDQTLMTTRSKKDSKTMKYSKIMKDSKSRQENIMNENKRIEQENTLNKYLLSINMNRSLDELHKKFESIKVKWNQFIKIKKKNFFLDYQVVYEIGEGSFGNVYKVKAIHTGIFRAAKKIYKNKLTEDLQQRLFEEITIMTNLDHPNINKILEVYEQNDFYVILIELCEGGQLFNKIVAKSLTETSAATIIKQILRALMYIHSKNIIHRDIKPENMLFEKGSNLIKIIDFGIATAKKTDKLTERLGTPYYIAPEILCKSYDEKCDLWSCGVILYMIIFGSPPFSGADEVEIMRNVLKEPLKFQGPKWNKLSPLGKDFLKGLLQKDPNSRFSAKEAFNHPWLSNAEQVYSNSIEYDSVKNLSRFHFKNKLQAVVLTYVVSQVLTSTEKLPLLKTFIEADTNSDGVLSFEEVKNLIKFKNPDLYKSLKVQTIDKLLKSMDLNNSGEIDFTEFLVATFKKSSITKEHLETAFSYFDIDHNGAITFSQIIQFLQNSNESMVALKKMFEKVDENRDGQISKDQFIKLMLNT